MAESYQRPENKSKRYLTQLNHTHLAYVLFRVGGYTNAECAELLGKSAGTCTNWGKDPLIKEVRQKVEANLQDAARGYLDHLLPEIVFTMATIMREGTSDRVRLDAASRLLEKALPAQTISTIKGDPNAPLLFDLTKTEADKTALATVAELSPDEMADFATTLDALEKYANRGMNAAESPDAAEPDA